MGKKKANQKGGHGKGKNQKSSSGTQKENSAPTEKSTSVSSNTAVDMEFTEVRRRKKLSRACKKNNDNDDYFRTCGLEVRSMTGDGNCLFRAFADQMEGTDKDHYVLRKIIVEHLVENKDDYAGFHEQEEEKTFEERLKKLAKLGSYGGQECLVAFARIFKRVVYVHQPDDKITLQFPPCQSSDLRKYKQIHILYTGGNHYDSIRLLGDSSRFPAAVLFVADEDGMGHYSADRRPDLVVVESPQTRFRNVKEVILKEETLEMDDIDNYDLSEKDSAIGSDCSASVTSGGSALSESENGDVVSCEIPPEGSLNLVIEVPLSPQDPDTVVSGLLETPDLVSSEPEFADAVPDSIEKETSQTFVDSQETSQSVVDSPVTENQSNSPLSAKKSKGSLSNKQKRALKKEKEKKANNPEPVTSKLPDPVAAVTRNMTHLRLVAV